MTGLRLLVLGVICSAILSVTTSVLAGVAISHFSIQNCRSANESKRTLAIVMRKAISIRYQSHDPAAALTDRQYTQLILTLLKERNC